MALTAFYAALPKPCNTPELRFPCADDRKAPVIAEVRSRLPADAVINEIDGLRVSTDGGWWLLRASNTQSMLVARCEAQDEAALAKIRGELGASLALSGIQLPDG